MTLAIHVVASRFALLVANPRLLRPDPVQLRDCEHTDRVEAHTSRCRDTNGPSWRVDTQVDVLDVFLDDVDDDVANRELRAHQYSPWALMMGKTRSTSSSSPNTP